MDDSASAESISLSFDAVMGSLSSVGESSALITIFGRFYPLLNKCLLRIGLSRLVLVDFLGFGIRNAISKSSVTSFSDSLSIILIYYPNNPNKLF